MNNANLPPVLREINTLMDEIKRCQPGQIKELIEQRRKEMIKQRRRARIMRIVDAVLRRVGL